MSTIRADNAGPSAGGTTTDLMQGLAKVWCQFTTITTTTNNGSLNVSGLTDQGPGDTDVTATNVFSGTGYPGYGLCGPTASNPTLLTSCRLNGHTASTLNFETGVPNASRGFQSEDCSDCNVAAHGELA